MPDQVRTDWQKRSRVWAANAVAGRSVDDDFNQMILAAAAIRPGETVLDTASGTGNPAISIALSMEGEGRVVCTDFTLGMLRVVRERAATLDLSIIDLACCDMRALPFGDGMFNCVTCRFGIMSVDDKSAALAEALRVLKPGGRAAYAVWGAYEENPPFHVPRRTVAEFFGEEDGPPPRRHSMGAPGTLEQLLGATGFERITEQELRYERPVPDLDEYISTGLARSFGDRIKTLDAEGRDALHAALRGAWKPFEKDGIVRVPNYARLGIGHRPA